MGAAFPKTACSTCSVSGGPGRRETPEGIALLAGTLTPNSDQRQISPCHDINAYSISQVMGIENMITQGEFSWYFHNVSTVFL